MSLRVYGRTEYAEPLMELGTAENGGEIRGHFDGKWVELVTFPEETIHWIIRDGEEVDDDRARA